jgi:transmembrane sensor
MEDRMDYIEELMIARISGNIEPKDSDFLDEMIEADAEVAALWQQHLLIASQLKNNYNKDEAWKNVLEGIARRKQKKRIPVPVFILVGVAAVVTTFVLLKDPKTVVTDHSGDGVPNLTTANTIRFTTGKESVSLNRNLSDTSTSVADIANVNGALVFTAKINVDPSTTSTLEVPQGLDRKIMLSDSSFVWVNAASKISFPLRFTGNTREVTLDGEAYFEVAKNKAKPFIVHAKDMDVQVLGTHFNIKAYSGEQIQASLTEGSVQASHQSQKIILTPGNAATIQGTSLTKKEFDESTVLAWMKGAYYFDNETLENISHTVDRWFGYRFSYTDPTIAMIGFSGALEKGQTIEVFLDRLCSSANLVYSISDRQVSLKKK